MSNNRLSVIIPGYNNPENYWCRCVQSVLNACGPNDEVICVDDGSKPEMRLSQYAKFQDLVADRRVIVISLSANRGLPTGRNEGIRASHGKYLTFVDSDDEVRPEVYEHSISSLEKHHSDIAIFGVDSIWVRDNLEKVDVLPERNIGMFTAETLACVFNACLFDYSCNKVYRREFLERNELCFETNVRTGEDTVFNCSCVGAGAKWCTVDYVGYIYYRYDGTMLSSYVPNIEHTHKRKLEARILCRKCCPGIDKVLGDNVEVSETAIDVAVWNNMWRRNSPYGFIFRWLFLKRHPKVARRSIVLEMAYRTIYTFLRNHFYIRPIRRWHIKRLYPTVKDVISK